MKLPRPEYAALGLCALIAVCMTVCSLLHVDAPQVFPTLATIALSAGVGIAAPALFASSTTPAGDSDPATPAAAEPAPAAAVKVPAPAAAPAVEAVASHAP